jgi:hypothetical protein
VVVAHVVIKAVQIFSITVFSPVHYRKTKIPLEKRQPILLAQMARLNDASSIPAESVEALKRRFMRQNRELAKTNSNQSIRIRCLEDETSRLLAENLALREDIIQLRNDLDTRPDRQAIGSVRDQLELKMQELSCLVSELGVLQRPGQASVEISEKPTRSPGGRRSWRRMEMLEEQEKRMPTIREDKYYPRRTMEYARAQILWRTC